MKDEWRKTRPIRGFRLAQAHCGLRISDCGFEGGLTAEDAEIAEERRRQKGQGIEGSRDQGIKGARDQGIEGARDQGDCSLRCVRVGRWLRLGSFPWRDRRFWGREGGFWGSFGKMAFGHQRSVLGLEWLGYRDGQSLDFAVIGRKWVRLEICASAMSLPSGIVRGGTEAGGRGRRARSYLVTSSPSV